MPADQIKIRAARPEDAGQIATVHIKTWQSSYAGIFPEDKLAELDQEHQTYSERWNANLTSGEQLPAFFVAEAGGEKIVGFAGAGRQNNPDYPYDGELFVIYILPKYQRRGLGRRLIAATAGKLHELGYASLMLWVLEENPGSRMFYETLGGKLAGRDEYLRWEQSHSIVAYAWESLTPLLNS